MSDATIELPNIRAQRRFIFEGKTKENKRALTTNLNAPIVSDLTINESEYSTAHLNNQDQWEAPDAEIIKAYISQFKNHTEYKTDQKIAEFLGILGVNANRRIRAYKNGSEKPPYGIWRKLLVATGRVNQEIIPVVAFFS